ncbi:alanine/glycine:cation symporter family protein [Mycoplasmatota bacterium zrk1]
MQLLEFFLVFIVIIFSVYFSFKFRFIQITGLKNLKREERDGISPRQTLLLTIATHVGTGNIVGVLVAILYGGSGAIFWMWVFSFFGAVLSVMENTLSQYFKVKVNGEARGGPSYYIEKGLNNPNLAKLFAVSVVISFGFLFPPIQMNAIVNIFNRGFGAPTLLVGGLVIILISYVVFSGIKSIINFTGKVVPLMALLYLGIGLYVILSHLDNVPDVLKEIVFNAFNGDSAIGGTFGAAISYGIRRGLFSNEAGIGTTPNISAISNVKKPIVQGMYQSIGVFIDTIVICTITALIVLLSDVDLSLYSGMDALITVFNDHFGSLGNILLAIIVLFFSITTLIGAYYMGETNFIYIGGNHKYIFFYRMLFVLSMIMGIFLSLLKVWQFADLGLLIMLSINIYALYNLRNVFKDLYY